MARIKFYDLPSVHPETWWSPNTYKTRFVLNYKRIPYTTIGIHYPDIEEESKKLGLNPAMNRPFWTVPIIVHEAEVVRGSFDIAKYLDNKFKDRPVVGEECSKWEEYIRKHVFLAVWPMTGPMVPTILNDKDREFFYRTRNVPQRQEAHAKVVETIWPLAQGIKETGCVYGGQIHYTDFMLASVLMWILRTKEDDFEKVMKALDIDGWWKEMSQYA